MSREAHTAVCGCYSCLSQRTDQVSGWPLTATRFVVCPDCGNKRCPKATHHDHACTRSNAPGQKGSRFGHWPQSATGEG